MPTRLVDFTINPLIALFFAVQKDTQEDSLVYTYKDCNINVEDNRVKILSILPTIENKTIENNKVEIKKLSRIAIASRNSYQNSNKSVESPCVVTE